MTVLFGIWLSVLGAVLPMTLYALLMWWADRYEREPWWLMVVAFVWGAIPAVVFTLVAHAVLGGGHEGFLLMCVEAPFIEELLKGLAVFGLFVFHRRQFDGVLDGLLYGALVGFGFSMTEDFLYYISALTEGGLPALLPLVFARSVFFALKHSVWTGLVGIGFGLAAVSRHRLARWGWPVAGFITAFSAHGIHNFGAYLMEVHAVDGEPALVGLGVLISLASAASGVLLIVAVVAGSWFVQRRIIREELAPLAGQILSAQEVAELSTRWTQPVSCRRPATLRKRKLVQLALRQRRLKSAGADNEPDLVAETGRLYHELKEEFAAA